MSSLTLAPRRGFRGEVQLPGSKSLSNRLLLLAALASAPTRLRGLLESDDVDHLLKALQTLGVDCQPQPEGDGWEISGGGFTSRGAKLFLGNAGTAFRPLTAVLAATPGDWTLLGEERMYQRPIGPLVQALQVWGARVEYLGTVGYPPLSIRGGSLLGGETRVDGTISSQFLTALLMASPLLPQQSQIRVEGEFVSQPYIDLTLQQMARFGVEVERPHERLFLCRPQSYRSPGEIWVEGDATAASYFLAGGAISGGPVRCWGAGQESLQGEIRFAHLLQEMGAEVSWGPNWVEVGRDLARPLRGITRNLADLPDSAMTLAAVGLFAEGTTEIRGVSNWRVKECDRQQALHDELSKLGAEVVCLEDGLQVRAPSHWRSAIIETYGDHRMAMCLSLAALGPEGLTVNHPEVVSKTFPDYFKEFARLSEVD